MKKFILLMFLSCFTAVGFAQNIYYWVGGIAEGSINDGSKWNTKQNGSGTSRVITDPATIDDILIIDGANIGGSTLTQGTALINLNTATTAQVKIINGASVKLVRVSNSNGTLTIANVTSGEPGLLVDATSSLQLNELGYTGNLYIDIPSPSTASIAGSIKLTQGGSTVGSSSPRITCRTQGGLVFTSGSSLEYDNTLSYPFGTLGAATSNSSSLAVVFHSGSDLTCNSAYSPFGTGSTNYIVDFKSGSNFYIKKTMTTGIVTNNRTYGNVFIQNGVTLTNDASAINKIENLTIDFGGVLNLGTSNIVLPIVGNLVVNGTINGTAANNNMTILMAGEGLTTVSGGGSITVTNFTVADRSSVKLEKNITVAGVANIYGGLDFSTYKIEGAGTFVARVNYESSSGLTYTNASNAITAGSYQITIPASVGLSGLPGLEITGPGIQPNTNIVSYASSAGQINLSKPATASSAGATIGFKSNVATLSTASPDGFNVAGSIGLLGSHTFNSGTNYVFNAATLTPFAVANGNALGDVTFNASATTNRNVTVNGMLTLNNAKLTVAEGNILTFAPTATFDGLFGNDAYISTASNTSSTTVGRVRLTDHSIPKLIPVGTATHYAPVTIAPTATSTFDINVFEGATANAAPNGTALTAAQKLRMVDAVWNINRTAGSGDATVTLGWDSALEGADFASFTNPQIGIASYASGAYGTFEGSGDATENTATLTTATFTPFIVGEANTTLPLTLINFTAKESLNSVKLTWQTTDEVNLKNYVLQHRTTKGFEDIYTVAANNKAGVFNYEYTHLNPVAGTNYYRLVGVDLDGTTHVSEPKSVNVTLGNAVTVYPNPLTNKNLSVSGVVKGDVIKILNIQGQVIASKTASGNQVEEINVQHLQAGTYIVSIENAGKVTSIKKVIKI